MMQIVKIPPRKRQLACRTLSISWLLMTWKCKEPGHQHPWQWPLVSMDYSVSSQTGYILLMLELEYFKRTRLMPWLLMPWWLPWLLMPWLHESRSQGITMIWAMQHDQVFHGGGCLPLILIMSRKWWKMQIYLNSLWPSHGIWWHKSGNDFVTSGPFY